MTALEITLIIVFVILAVVGGYAIFRPFLRPDDTEPSGDQEQGGGPSGEGPGGSYRDVVEEGR